MFNTLESVVERSDEVDATLTGHLAAIASILEKTPDLVRPYSGHCEIAKLGARAITAGLASGDAEPEEYASAFVHGLSREARAHILFQILGSCIDLETDQPSREGNEMLLELTEIMGSDYAQGFYRLAVLYTKIV